MLDCLTYANPSPSGVHLMKAASGTAGVTYLDKEQAGRSQATITPFGCCSSCVPYMSSLPSGETAGTLAGMLPNCVGSPPARGTLQRENLLSRAEPKMTCRSSGV